MKAGPMSMWVAAWVMVSGSVASAGPERGNDAEAQHSLRHEPATCSHIDVSATPEATEKTRKRGYSAREILDLNFHVYFPRSLPESMELKLFTPNGHLYQSIAVPIATTGSRETWRKMGGYPSPVKVARARHDGAAQSDGTRRGRTRARRSLLRVDAPPFPVGGTAIVTNSLYGQWRAEVWSAGAKRSCAVSFKIAP